MSSRPSHRQRHVPGYRPLDDSTLRAVRTFVEEGATRKAVNFLLSESCHDSADPAVLVKLRDLHPAAAPHLKAQDRTSPHLTTNCTGLQVLERLIRDFPPASAAGRSGLRPQHLQDALRTAEHGASHRILIALDHLAL